MAAFCFERPVVPARVTKSVAHVPSQLRTILDRNGRNTSFSALSVPRCGSRKAFPTKAFTPFVRHRTYAWPTPCSNAFKRQCIGEHHGRVPSRLSASRTGRRGRAGGVRRTAHYRRGARV